MMSTLAFWITIYIYISIKPIYYIICFVDIFSLYVLFIYYCRCCKIINPHNVHGNHIAVVLFNRTLYIYISLSIVSNYIIKLYVITYMCLLYRFYWFTQTINYCILSRFAVVSNFHGDSVKSNIIPISCTDIALGAHSGVFTCFRLVGLWKIAALNN